MSQSSVPSSVLWLLLLAVVLASVWVTGFTPEKMQTWGNAWSFVQGMFPPDWSVLPDVLRAMGETIGIAVLGTVLALALAFPLSFLTARNIAPWWIGAPLRWLMAVLRSVPEILWALIFVVATEFGNVPGILALAAHNTGILAKLVGEIFEEAPVGLQEAIAATGANRSLVVWYGILPWALPGVLSQVFFRLECNIRTATILGMVNAGGIGYLLMAHRQLLQYDAMLVDTLGILTLVLLSEGMGALLRRRVT